jgi:hypothetical protein
MNASPAIRTIDLQLRTLHQDPQPIEAPGGGRAWRAVSTDPSFIAAVPPGAPLLQPGYYLARAIVRPLAGEVVEPQIYIPDAHGRFAEERSVRMADDGTGFKARFLLAQPSTHVRFDPSRAPCEFSCDALEVERVGDPPRKPLLERTVGRLRSWFSRPLQVMDAAGLSLSAGRKKRVLATIDREGFGVEIGPSHDPIAPKRDGFKVHVIDHASREELLAKYATHVGLALDRIEEVDFVWRGQSYVELTGHPRHYSWIIASHVIEHTPDLIAFLADCDSILKDGGVLSLVIPDKRYCFDRFRPVTGLARVVDAHMSAQKIHTPGAVAEYLINAVGKPDQLAWDAGTVGEYRLFHTAEQAQALMQDVLDHRAYHDIHNWCFVPHSFRLLLADLHALGLTPMREVSFEPTHGCEFYVTLGRHGSGPALSRLDLLKAIDQELAEAAGR